MPSPRKSFAVAYERSGNDGVERAFVLILDGGEEAFGAISDFAELEKITGASVSASAPSSQAGARSVSQPPTPTEPRPVIGVEFLEGS
jgi:hypothetical protein